jgi:hypothetical protein
MIRIDITEVGQLVRLDDGSIGFLATDKLRGEISVRIAADEARLFLAQGMDTLREMRRDAGEDD